VTNRRGTNGYSIYSQKAFIDLFKWFDQNRDKSVSVRELEVVFNLMDSNKNGYIQPSEMDK
jgi:Ca2+-binding EF-hand superfamily protein